MSNVSAQIELNSPSKQIQFRNTDESHLSSASIPTLADTIG